jgi:hypothetical protein
MNGRIDPMKYFLIKYRFEHGAEADWHREVAAFIAALDADPELQGRIAYRCLKARDGKDYVHIAAAADDAAPKTLGQRDYFKAYTQRTKEVSAGNHAVVPFELVAETRFKA